MTKQELKQLINECVKEIKNEGFFSDTWNKFKSDAKEGFQLGTIIKILRGEKKDDFLRDLGDLILSKTQSNPLHPDLISFVMLKVQSDGGNIKNSDDNIKNLLPYISELLSKNDLKQYL